MFGHIEVFQLAQHRAQHSSARQAMVAANIANADTPGYRATDVKPFMDTYSAPRSQVAMHASRSGHLGLGMASDSSQRIERIDRPSGASPNGNTVSLEIELLHGIDADRAHNRAVTIYQTALSILRTAISAGR